MFVFFLTSQPHRQLGLATFAIWQLCFWLTVMLQSAWALACCTAISILASCLFSFYLSKSDTNVKFSSQLGRHLAFPPHERAKRGYLYKDILATLLFWGIPFCIMLGSFLRGDTLDELALMYFGYLIGSTSFISLLQYASNRVIGVE